MPLNTCIQLDPAQDNQYDEQLFELALSGPQALLWQGSKGLVVPKLYAQSPRFQHSLDYFSALGWPISVRQSGGGVVPQGPGIWNLSLAWRQYGKPLDLASHAYEQLCAPIAQALSHCGVQSSTQAVDGSFCDGRFNLAVTHEGQHKKIVGTAQVWRRCAAPKNITLPPAEPGSQTGWHIVLAHALILLDCAEQELTELANQVESQLQRTQRYLANRICDLKSLGVKPETFLPHLTTALQSVALPHDQFAATPLSNYQT